MKGGNRPRVDDGCRETQLRRDTRWQRRIHGQDKVRPADRRHRQGCRCDDDPQRRQEPSKIRRRQRHPCRPSCRSFPCCSALLSSRSSSRRRPIVPSSHALRETIPGDDGRSKVTATMDFRIADTFTDSLARLTGDEQKAVKTTAFDLQMNPASPGMQLPQARQGEGQELLVGAGQRRHPADRPQDRRQPAALLRRSPRQGLRLGRAAQARDAPEDRRGAAGRDPRDGPGGRRPESRRRRAAAPPPKPQPLFARRSRRRAARLRRAAGVAGRRAAGRRGHACSRWPTTCRPRRPRRCWNWRPAASRAPPQPAPAAADPFEHPDAQRRFRVDDQRRGAAARARLPVGEVDGLPAPRAARSWVERDYAGPARVSGSAGTGKTIVALHRAVHLARAHPDARVLLTTFSDTLANALQTQAAAAGRQRAAPGRADRRPLARCGRRCGSTRRTLGPAARWPAATTVVDTAGGGVATAVGGHKFSPHFLLDRMGAGRRCLAARRPGRPIATSPGSAARRGCRRRSARCCGRSSSRSGPA